jgi:hypothetical protein
MIVILGRGHSGTRAFAKTLYASDVRMGRAINFTGDLVPPRKMFEAGRIVNRLVKQAGFAGWDFSRVHKTKPTDDWRKLVHSYLLSVEGKHWPSGFKLPEAIFSTPWLVKEFPDAHYIWVVRDPRDVTRGGHQTDDLERFAIPHPTPDDEMLRRAISWKYQYDVVATTPKPQRWLKVRFEDFVLAQEKTLERMEAFLGFELARIPVHKEAAFRWRRRENVPTFDFWNEIIAREWGEEQ